MHGHVSIRRKRQTEIIGKKKFLTISGEARDNRQPYVLDPAHTAVRPPAKIINIAEAVANCPTGTPARKEI